MRNLSFVFLFCLPLVAAENPCDTEQTFDINGETPAECGASAKKYSGGKYENCYEVSGESWLGALAVLEQSCVRKTMDKELDKRLVPLKTSEPKAFRKEMDLQKEFIKAAKKFCEEWSGGTAGRYNEPGCWQHFWEYRFDQAKAINDKALTFASGSAKKTPPAFAKYTKMLCELPSTVWKDGSSPKNCAQLLLADMQKRKLFALPGDS